MLEKEHSQNTQIFAAALAQLHYAETVLMESHSRTLIKLERISRISSLLLERQFIFHKNDSFGDLTILWKEKKTVDTYVFQRLHL